MDGWLLKLVHMGGSVEDSVASWALTKCMNLSQLCLDYGLFSLLYCILMLLPVSAVFIE